jgi:hypothetical protein
MNASSHRFLAAAAALFLVLAALFAMPVRTSVDAAAALFYVDYLAPDGGNGLTWATAFNNLQAAINKVQTTAVCASYACEIWVAQGVYQPMLNGYFDINGGYEVIYGGFSGIETELSQRDWRAHPTTLLGNNSGVVRAYGWVGALDGFTITGGSQGVELGRGGGIYLYCGSPTLSNLTIVGNSANNYGGGVYAYAFGCPYPGYYPTFMNVVISNNTSPSGGGAAFLGGHPALINTAFWGNSATQGDGIYDYSSSPTLTNVTMYTDGIHNNIQAKPAIQNSILWGPDAAILNEESTSIPTITYSLVKGCYEGSWNAACGTDSGHNLPDQDPKFVDNTLTDLHLQESSPVIDQGYSAFVPPYVTPTDLDGNPRVVGAAIDLGVYEFQSANIPPVVTNFTKTGWKNHDIVFSAADFTSHFSDADGNSLVSVRITFLPAPGVLYLDAAPVTVNQVVPIADLGDLYFTPPLDWGGKTTFGWSASDGTAFASSPAVATLKVFRVNLFLPAIMK